MCIAEPRATAPTDLEPRAPIKGGGLCRNNRLCLISSRLKLTTWVQFSKGSSGRLGLGLTQGFVGQAGVGSDL